MQMESCGRVLCFPVSFRLYIRPRAPSGAPSRLAGRRARSRRMPHAITSSSRTRPDGWTSSADASQPYPVAAEEKHKFLCEPGAALTARATAEVQPVHGPLGKVGVGLG